MHRQRKLPRKRWKIGTVGMLWTAFVGVIGLGQFLFLRLGIKPFSSKEVWIVGQSGPGRLGNQMFQYASTLAIYHHRTMNNPNNDIVRFCVDPKHPFPLQEIFRGPFTNYCPEDALFASVRQLSEKGYGIYTDFDSQIASCWRFPCFFGVGVYLQSFKYLAFAADDIRSAFRFRSTIRHHAILQMNSIRTNSATLVVGIHVRRGDLQIVPYLRMAPASYFGRAMQHFRDRFGENGVRFVVASDDMDWCKRQKAVFGGADFLDPNDGPAMNLAVLSLADHMIISVGTFGWWAAWLAAGEVIYFQDALVMDHPTNKNQIEMTDYYPPNWIGMS